MSKHFNEAVEGDDGGLVICRGCKTRGTYATPPSGKCPTPYKSDGALLEESLAREQALQQCLTAADEQLDQAVTALNEIAKASRMGEKPFEIATLAIGEMSALPPASGGDEHDATKDLACYFGLTYASWLTLPRVLMESMPEEWKRSMATLLNQYDDAYPNQPSYGTTVRVTVDGKMVRTPEWLINYRHPDRSMINQVRGLSG